MSYQSIIEKALSTEQISKEVKIIIKSQKRDELKSSIDKERTSPLKAITTVKRKASSQEMIKVRHHNTLVCGQQSVTGDSEREIVSKKLTR